MFKAIALLILTMVSTAHAADYRCEIWETKNKTTKSIQTYDFNTKDIKNSEFHLHPMTYKAPGTYIELLAFERETGSENEIALEIRATASVGKTMLMNDIRLLRAGQPVLQIVGGEVAYDVSCGPVAQAAESKKIAVVWDAIQVCSLRHGDQVIKSWQVDHNALVNSAEQSLNDTFSDGAVRGTIEFTPDEVGGSHQQVTVVKMLFNAGKTSARLSGTLTSVGSNYFGFYNDEDKYRFDCE